MTDLQVPGELEPGSEPAMEGTDERLLGREETAGWPTEKSPLWRSLEAEDPPRTGILIVGLSHGVHIPSSVTVNLKGSL